MILDYKECISKFGSNYYLNSALRRGEIYKVKKGVYSTSRLFDDREVLIKEHNNIIFTMDSAFYYYGFTDVIPNINHVATDKDSAKITGDKVKQYFYPKNIVNIGRTTLEANGINIPIYNKERLLIELVRYKNKLPFDYYKEVIAYYRNHIDEISISLVLDYLENFPKKQMITRIIQMEVL